MGLEFPLFETARSLLRVVAKRGLSGPDISATKQGTMLLTWSCADRLLHLELTTSDPKAVFWYSGESEDKKPLKRTENDEELLGLIERLQTE